MHKKSAPPTTSVIKPSVQRQIDFAQPSLPPSAMACVFFHNVKRLLSEEGNQDIYENYAEATRKLNQQDADQKDPLFSVPTDASVSKESLELSAAEITKLFEQFGVSVAFSITASDDGQHSSAFIISRNPPSEQDMLDICDSAIAQLNGRMNGTSDRGAGRWH